MATIGKNILENLTTGMYADSKVIYREYVQNACDQIDKAVELGIIDREQAEVFISIEEDSLLKTTLLALRKRILLHSWVILQTLTKK